MASKKSSRRTTRATDAATGSRYIVNHAFSYTDESGEEHWITTATAGKIEAVLPKDVIADKVAAGMLSDTQDTATNDPEAAE